MADNGKITILVTSGDISSLSGGQNGTNGTNGANGKNGTNGKNITDSRGKAKSKSNIVADMSRYMAMRLAESAVNETTNLVNASVNTIGARTGDYQDQYDTQFTFSIAQKACALGLEVGVDLLFGRPDYAVFQIATTAVSIGASLAISNYNQNIENTRSNINASVLRDRSGLNVYNNDSRGTDN